MSKLFVEKSIEINAPASKVWQVFTDPAITRQIGGEYVSDWKVGSSFGWKGLDGKMVTNGTILKIEPEKLLQHNLLTLLDPLIQSSHTNLAKKMALRHFMHGRILLNL